MSRSINSDSKRLFRGHHDAAEPLIQQDPSQRPEIRRSINILTLTVFLQSTGFTLMLPSQWYYLESVGGTEAFLGYVIGIYSIGQLIGSLLFGYWANHRPTREALIISLSICILGNIWYSFIYLLPEPGWEMFAARFFVGFGAGNISTSRAYMSEATSLSGKVAVMAKMSAAQAIGFVMGPAIGFALSWVDFHIGSVLVDKYTAPSFLAVLTTAANIAVVPLITELRHSAKGGTAPPTPKSEMIAMIVAMFLFFNVTFVFAVFESTITLMTAQDFDWSVRQNGILFFAVGIESIVVFIIISLPFFKRFNDRWLFQAGMLIQVLGLLMLATWGPPMKWEEHLPMWQFLVGCAIMSIGYPVATALVYALFSKVISPVYQGTKMGYHNASGCVARIVGPIWATNAYAFKGAGGGGEILFFGTALFVVIGIAVCFGCWRWLVPHPDYNPNKPGQIVDSPGGQHPSLRAESIKRIIVEAPPPPPQDEPLHAPVEYVGGGFDTSRLHQSLKYGSMLSNDHL